MISGSLPSTLLFAGALILIVGIIILTILQSILIGKLNKSFFTFLSVMFYPKQELSDKECLLKTIGNYLTIIGALIVIFAGYFVWLKQ